MISISEKIYRDLASRLINELQDSDFYNGSIELDYCELYSTLHCTLLIYTADSQEHETPRVKLISEIVPVWWEFETASSRGFEYNDFSWCEFYEYLKTYFY